MDPATATAALSAVSSAFDKLTGAIIESKRIDAEIAAVRAQAEVEHHRLDVQEKALDLRHKQIMKMIEEEANIIKKRIESSQKAIQSNIKTQEFFRNQLDQVFNIIINSKTSKKEKEFLLGIYREIAQELRCHSQEAVNIIQTSDSTCLDSNRIPFTKTNQLSSGEK